MAQLFTARWRLRNPGDNKLHYRLQALWIHPPHHYEVKSDCVHVMHLILCRSNARDVG